MSSFAEYEKKFILNCNAEEMFYNRRHQLNVKESLNETNETLFYNDKKETLANYDLNEKIHRDISCVEGYCKGIERESCKIVIKRTYRKKALDDIPEFSLDD